MSVVAVAGSRGRTVMSALNGNLALPGCPYGLRSHPTNLIRVMPAKGDDGSTSTDDCGLRFRWGCRDPGRPEGLRGCRLPRDKRDRGADSAEHDRRDRGARGATR